MKKLLMIMIVCMAAIVPAGCNNEYKANDEDDFTWYESDGSNELIPKGGIIITGYVGTDTDVVIPQSINDKPVVAIDHAAFSPFSEEECKDFFWGNSSRVRFWANEIGLSLYEKDGEEIFEIDDTEIGYISAEEQESYLASHDALSEIKRIAIPSSVKYIGNCAFFFCDSVEKIEVYGDPNVKIPSGGAMFAYCTFLKSIGDNFVTSEEITDGSVPRDLYWGCNSLEEITVGGEELYLALLKDSKNLKKIIIEDGVKSIYGAYQSRELYLENMNYSQNEYDYGYNVLQNVEEIYIPASVEEIELDGHIFCNHTLEQIREYDELKGQIEPNYSHPIQYGDYVAIYWMKLNTLEIVRISENMEALYEVEVSDLVGDGTRISRVSREDDKAMWEHWVKTQDEWEEDLWEMVVEAHENDEGLSHYGGIYWMDEELAKKCIEYQNDIVNTNITIVTPKGSYAETYAKLRGIPYRNE